MPVSVRRIAFVTTEYPPHLGGAARSAQRLVRGLSNAGHDVVVFGTPSPRRPAETLPTSDGRVRVHWLPSSDEEARQLIAREDALRRFDLFHGFTLPAARPCLGVARKQRPVIASIRGVDGLSFDERAMEVLRGCDCVTSVSRDSLARAGAVVDISTRSVFIPNGVDLDRFDGSWTPTADNDGVIGTVATFRRKKNMPLLVRSYAALDRATRRRLLLVGDSYDGDTFDPMLRRKLDDLLVALDVASETQIVGMVDHDRVAEYHRRMRVFALTSDHEGMPNAVLEAAASGVPIVATAVDGVKDLLTNGEDALLVEPRQVQAFTAALRLVLTTPDLAARLSAAGRQTAERLGAAKERERYLSLYESLLANLSSRAAAPR